MISMLIVLQNTALCETF
uniref:Uncharacterized protein n=1 Tax=Arundo donax TaxID=35708 RepID=A0A0A9EPD1_ARUDO